MNEYWVAQDGNDKDEGSKRAPFATVARAQEAVQHDAKRGVEPINIYLRGGTHYLAAPIRFTKEDSGGPDAAVTWCGEPGAKATLSAGRVHSGTWQAISDKILSTELDRSTPSFTQLFINGMRMHRARYPNFAPDDPLVHGRGYTTTLGEADDGSGRLGFRVAPEEFSDRKWARANEAVVHISHNWGFLQFRVDELDAANGVIWLGEGGWQINLTGPKGEFGLADPLSLRSWLFTERRFFVENVREELDTPGEWYVDGNRLLVYPPTGVNLDDATVEYAIHEHAVVFDGTESAPVEHLHLDSLRFAHTESTFLSDYVAPSMGDWTIHRGGVVLLRNTRDCAVTRCFFDQVGGNAVFLDRDNRRARIAASTFSGAGESAICIVGAQNEAYGTKTPYSTDTVIENNHIHDIGAFGKQVAGVFVSSAFRTTIRHNLMHSLPRAGICLNDCWGGGHVIEHNEIHDTVRETRDHGPFNSWGREGFWCENQSHRFGDVAYPHPVRIGRMPEQTVIRNNYFHGIEGYVMGDYRQAIDLDDGSTNFHVYNNLCVDIAISIREGDFRIVENNIIIDPIVPFGMHVLFDQNHDIVRHNIIVTDRETFFMNDAPPTQPWLEVDENLLFSRNQRWGHHPHVVVNQRGGTHRTYTLDEWKELGYDQNSVYADPCFVAPEDGDYRVTDESPALRIGFVNFPMDFGLTPEFPSLWQ